MNSDSYTSSVIDMQDNDLSDFISRALEFEGNSKAVYTQGSGPAVIIMAEMPGITPQLLRFARRVSKEGFTVYLPSLFGVDGANTNATEGMEIARRTCISAEFSAFKGGRSSKVTDWLRSLARHALAECKGPGVGAIGMCFTGNFALSMMLEPAMIAPVLAQPSLPLDNPAGLEISNDELRDIRNRLNEENLEVLGYRFEGDSFCRAQRFAAYQLVLGDRFKGKVLPDACANTEVPEFTAEHVKTPHSIFTAHFVDEVGHPTHMALNEVLTFFRERLLKDY